MLHAQPMSKHCACTVPRLLGLVRKALVLGSPKSHIPLESCKPVSQDSQCSSARFQPFTCSSTCSGDATLLPNGKLMVCFRLPLTERHPQAESMEKFNPRWRPQDVLISWKPRMVMVKTVGCTTGTETLSWSAMRRGPTILQMTLTWKKKIPFVWGWLVLLLQEGFQQYQVKSYGLCTGESSPQCKSLKHLPAALCQITKSRTEWNKIKKVIFPPAVEWEWCYSFVMSTENLNKSIRTWETFLKNAGIQLCKCISRAKYGSDCPDLPHF